MKICCMVTLYNPNVNQLRSILEYSRIFEKVYVYDNSSTSVKETYKEFFSDNVEYLFNGDNDGLSVAFNACCKLAILDGFHFICLMDQDSCFSGDDIGLILDYIYDNPYDNTAIIGPAIKYSHSKGLDTSSDWLISSGSFINLNLFLQTPGFDENLFIDRIDYDYCICVKNLRYDIKVIAESVLEQELGEKRDAFFLSYFEHSPIRTYYMFRNRIYFYLIKYPSFKNYLRCGYLSIKQLFSVLLLQSDKLLKLKAILLAVKDFNSRKFGKIDCNYEL